MNPAPATPGSPALEMHDVAVGTLRDPEMIVVESVRWSVATGDFWVIGGMQGAGKSDFLMMAGGLVAPVAGAYYCFGEEMPIFDEGRLRERMRLGLVFDGGQLIHHLTVAENIALPLRYHRNLAMAGAAAEVRRMLELTELLPWADSTPGALRRNWQKRVGLARALMLRPEILLLDNPLAGLDLRQSGWWLDFLEQLSKGHEWLNGRPITLVATADDLRPWRNRAKQFAVLNNKRLVVLGPWDKVEAAGDTRVQELLAVAPPQPA